MANGDVVAVVLFGSLAGFALAGGPVLDRRRRRHWGRAAWQALARDTATVPMAAIVAGRARFPTDRRTMAGAAAGLLLYAGMIAGGHQWLIGVPPWP